MGKNRVIKTLIKFTSNIILHKIIFKFGNRLSAKNFVESEIIAYRESAVEEAGEYNWNQQDKNKILFESKLIAKNRLSKDYSDISFSQKDIEYFAKETLDEIFS